nr:immunoglobulin heavy chain junction region [Mus musculus]MBK4189380.1 immunoglobulin heavy chain junction region [Mus musculus]
GAWREPVVVADYYGSSYIDYW